jgi:thiamine biosynthesis lipoprotein
MSALASPPAAEACERFDCFGGTCTVTVRGAGAGGSAQAAADRARRRLLEWHAQFSRFAPSSELSRLNRDPRPCVPVSPLMARFVQAAIRAADLTGGLVDPTLVGEIEAAGYFGDLTAPADCRPEAGWGRPAAPVPAAPAPAARWRAIDVDVRAGTVTRPAGVRLDSGGVAKGLFGDVLAGVLRWHPGFAIDSAGDIVLGGCDELIRRVRVADPFGDRVLHSFELSHGAVATSGITRRSWLDQDGRLAHHLLDPSTGRPAFTGIVQATALAPSGLEAEALAKAALLSGPARAERWLRHGGVLVYDDGSRRVFES